MQPKTGIFSAESNDGAVLLETDEPFVYDKLSVNYKPGFLADLDLNILK
jgi:hypothetical protein